MTVFGAVIIGLILGSFYNVCIFRYISGNRSSFLLHIARIVCIG